MARKDKVKYWIRSADQDWKVANHLFEKGDYSYALFFGHLTIYKKSTMEFTENKLKQIERLKKWLLQKPQSSI